MKLILKWLICFGALLAAQALFPAEVSGGVWQFAVAALVLWLLNLLVRPLLQVLCLPVSMLTFGLFFFVVNTWMVSITDALLPFLRVDGFWLRLFVALLVSVGNAVLIGARHRRSEA
ncbi:MAG: phage holin family protein [Bacillota bacterium]